MNIDETTIRIIKEIRQELKEKKDIDISEEELIDIISSEFKGTVYGLKKGISTILPLIGRFLYIDRSTTMEKISRLSKIKDFYSESEFNQLQLEGKINTLKRNKDRWKKERDSNLEVIDVIRKDNISNGKIIYDTLSKLLQDGK